VVSLVPNSGQPAGANSANNVVEVDDLGNGTYRLAVVSPATLSSGPVATFQVQGVAALKPWDSSTVTITAANSVSGDNATGTIAVRNFGNSVLVAGKWVIDNAITSQAAASIATANGAETVYFGYDNGQLHANKVADGSAGFGAVDLADLGIGPIIRRPIFKDNFVYVSSNTGSVAKVDATNGAVAWKVALSGGRIPSTAPAIDGTSVYVGTQQGVVVKLNAADGAELASSAALGSAISADPAANATEVWIGSGNRVLSLNPADLTPKKDFTTGGAVNSPPFISPLLPGIDGAGARVVAVGSADGKLYLFDSSTGLDLGSYNAGAPIVAASYVDWPSAGNLSTVYVVTTNGDVHAVTLSGLNPAQMGQNLTGRVVASGLGAVNTAIIAAGDPKYGYVSSPASFAGLKLPVSPTAQAGAAVTVGTPYQAFAPAAAVGSDTLIVTLASGAVVAVPLLPEGTVGQ
jgi:outer membrane protein assembly factor BamB